ncbi:MAG: hypothetical protein WC817_04515 [Patescibacteria group bacterium]|jgi:hypothetical protein
MLSFKKVIKRQLSRHTQGLLLTTIFIIGGSAIILGGISIRKSVYAPFAVSSDGQNQDIFAAANGSITNSNIDTDGDGLSDADEVNVYKTSPYLADSDSDGIPDGQEIANSTDPNCPTGQDCSSPAPAAGAGTAIVPITGANPTATTPTPTPTELRALLKQSGMSEQEIAGLTDAQLIASYQQALATQQQNAAAQKIQNLSPSELRALLKQDGIDDATLSEVTDAELLQLYQQTLEQLKISQKP